MDVLRTPDTRFVNLPEFAYPPRYAHVDDGDGGRLRVAYLDEGPPDGGTVVLMHGEPSWSFLYRRMIPPLVAAGLRVIAPDLVGFGRSDKPTRRTDYSYARHVEWMRHTLLDAVGVRDATLVGQDWGGLIGLRLVAENPDRFARVVIANTGLPTGDQRMTEAFLAWRRYSQESPDLPVGNIVSGGCTTTLTAETIAAYDAPFPDETYKAGARMFPMLVPTSPDDPASEANRRAWSVLRTWDKPLLTAFSDADPVTAGGDKPFRELVPGAANRDHQILTGGGHFLQEDLGPRFAEVIIKFIGTT